MFVFDQQTKNQRSLHLLASILLVGLLILTARLWFIQIVISKNYQNKLDVQAYRTVRSPAIRGKIYDRNEIPLVENRLRYQLKLYLEELRPYFQDQYNGLKSSYRETHGKWPDSSLFPSLGKEARYQVVSNITFNISQFLGAPRVLAPDRFHRHYQATLPLPLPVMDDLTPAQVAMYFEKAPPFPGLNLEVQAFRTNRFQTLAAHTLGYLRRNDLADWESDHEFYYLLPDFEGAFGIEGVFDKELRGKAGLKALLINHLGYRQMEHIWIPSVPGKNIHLTLDVDIQLASEIALRSIGVNTRGAVVVVDVTNGDILALASSPTFDPNLFVDGISSETYQALNEVNAMFNRATFGAYPPGSVFKAVVGLAGLGEGTLDPDKVYFSPGYYRFGRGALIRDTAGPGEFDFNRAFKRSSNPYFITNALAMGKDPILELAHQFQLGKETGIPIMAETAGYLPKPGVDKKRHGGRWLPGDTANLSIGQGEISTTPLQIAMMTAAIANGGTVFKPRLVTTIEPQDITSDAGIRYIPEGVISSRIQIPARYLKVLHRAMRADVGDGYRSPGGAGTGHLAEVPGMEICGKTGTAQVPYDKNIDSVTWFASFSSLSNPKYAVVVMVINGESGGSTCAPIARKIYEAIQNVEENRRSNPIPARSEFFSFLSHKN